MFRYLKVNQFGLQTVAAALVTMFSGIKNVWTRLKMGFHRDAEIYESRCDDLFVQVRFRVSSRPVSSFLPCNVPFSF